MKLITNSFFLLVLFSIFSCNRNDITSSLLESFDPFEVQHYSKSSVMGTVLDEKYKELLDVEVKYFDFNNDSKSTTTDLVGNYLIRNKFLNENGQLLTFAKKNHFKQYAYFEPTLNSLSFVNTILLRKDNSKKIIPIKTNHLSFYNSIIKCDIPKGIVISKNGSKVNTEINIYFKSPSLENSSLCQPDFGSPNSKHGIDFDGGKTLLLPIYSFFIQLEDKTENELYLSDSMTINVSVNSIPCIKSKFLKLWKFNTNSGIWETVSLISYNSTTLSFKVNETGYYSISNNSDIISKLTGKIFFHDQQPAKNISIKVYDKVSYLLQQELITDAFGNFTLFKENSSEIFLRITGCNWDIHDYEINKNQLTIDDIFLPKKFNTEFHVDLDFNIPFGFMDVYNSNAYFPFTTYPTPYPYGDSTNTSINFNGCNSSLIYYDLSNLPTIYENNVIYLEPNQKLDKNSFQISNTVSEYIYLNIGYGSKQVFNSYISYYNSNNYIEVFSLTDIIFIKFSKSENICHISYFNFIDNDEYEYIATTNDNPLSFTIIEEDNSFITAHFKGNIEHNGIKKDIEGYFKTKVY